MNWRLHDPWWLLALIFPLLVVVLRRRHGGAAFGAYILAARALRPSWSPLLHRLLVASALCAMIIALARPQYGREVIEREHSGRDLMLLVDLSASMIADDMFAEDGRRIDRLEAIFRAAEVFIEGRPSDRLGLSLFGSTALVVCPPTLDHESLVAMLHDIEAQMRDDWQRGIGPYGIPTSGIVGPGTNTGLGIAMTMPYLEDEATSGKAIIILTDGRDSRRLGNWVDPVQATRQADRLGIRVHAIGVGDRNGMMTDPRALHHFGQQRLIPLWPEFLPDQPRLEEIVEVADGEAMHADSREDIMRIFRRIDELEPSEHVFRRLALYADRFALPLWWSVLLLLAAALLEPRLRGVPR